MKKKGIALTAVFAVIVVLMLLGSPGLGSASPQLSLIPVITINPGAYTLMTVDVPDAALNQALHTKTGTPIGDKLYLTDLKAITGSLSLSGLGISNAEGLQYCTGITGLYLMNNNLSALPANFKNLTALHELVLEGNQFEDFPAVLLQMPALKVLSLVDNKLGSLPATINSMTDLWSLNVSHNKLTALPSSLWKLAKLKYLYCSDNQIDKIPKELFKAPLLDTLDLGTNKIKEIPAEVKSAPKLKLLGLQYNMLTKLPAGIGNAPKLEYLVAGYNALSTVESSLYKGNVKNLVLTGNRIKSLPEDMKNESFQILRIEWNFMDVAPGSGDKAILDSLTIAPANLSYKNQLSRVHITSSSSTKDTITLKWNSLSDGSVGGVSWKVLKFEVYDATDSAAKLLDTLDESSAQDTLDGLDPSKEYNLFVRALYELNDSGMKSQTSCDTFVKVTTKDEESTATPEPSATAEPTAEPTAALTATAEATAAPAETPTAAPASTAASGGDSGLLIALIAVGAVVAVALIVLIVVLTRRKPQTIRIRR